MKVLQLRKKIIFSKKGLCNCWNYCMHKKIVIVLNSCTFEKTNYWFIGYPVVKPLCQYKITRVKKNHFVSYCSYGCFPLCLEVQWRYYCLQDYNTPVSTYLGTCCQNISYLWAFTKHTTTPQYLYRLLINPAIC